MNAEQRKIAGSFFLPLLFVTLLWLVKLTEYLLKTDFTHYGVYPRELEGLKGILFMPLVHNDLKHLFSNSVPLLLLGAAMMYFYREPALRVMLLVYFLHGFWLWLSGRPSWHIGASGVVYGLASFLFFSGIFRKYIPLMAISLLVVFLYGGMIWGLFPLFKNMSWEAHVCGGAAGLLCALLFRREGPQRQPYDWENEDENDDEQEAEAEPETEEKRITINYIQPEKPPAENNEN